MNLRTLNTTLLVVLLVGCAMLWSRELRLRQDFAEESKCQGILRTALTEEQSRASGLREDLAELRVQLEKTQAQREEALTAASRQTAEFNARTEKWLDAQRHWEGAVKERDTRISQMIEREALLSSRLDEAAQRVQKAADQIRELEKRPGRGQN